MIAILIPLLVYFSVATLYYLFFSTAAHFDRKKKEPLLTFGLNKIAVFIPAYKEDAVIVNTAKEALQHNYPTDRFDVVVIADSLQQQTLNKLRKLPIKLIEVSFDQSTKAKAINQAYEKLTAPYDMAVILDADNVMAESFLHQVNLGFNRGYLAIQGHRMAKNQQNALAFLDAVSEEINNSIFRKGHQSLGLSSALIGSGMAFDYEFFRAVMLEISALGGFDKALELKLLRENIEIKYIEEAVVLDEKVSDSRNFENQRTRWIAAQMRYGLNSFKDACAQLIHEGNWDYFDKSFQFLLPPRLLLIGILVMVSGILLLTHNLLWIGFVVNLAILAIALAIAIPGKFWSIKLLKSTLSLPKTFLLMLLAAMRFNKAKNNFLHTSHHS